MGAMRWAQTANFGVLPNTAMPNTFLAQAFDLDDPFSNITCYKAGCCPNNYHPKGSCDGCLGIDQYCASLSATNYYMGPIHPRDKKPVGQRLAQAGAVVAYGKSGLATGPTLSGCQVSGGNLLVSFNTSLLGADAVSVQDYKKLQLQSRVEVLVNASLFCLQTANKGHECIDDGTGRDIGAGAFDEASSWVPVNISSAGPSSILVDLSTTGGVAFGVRYAWQGGCCDDRPRTSDPCPVASCPILAQGARLPANPFMAHIADGKCRCVAPQTCDETSVEEFV
jgi:sialate O-acetylesterase